MRFLLCLCIVLVGCVATLPADDSVSADLAAETARMVIQLRREIAPTPAPPSDGKCQNCEGRGYVGDGRVRVTCQPCGGTGKVKAQCPDGKCPK